MEGKREQADGPLLDLRVWSDPPLVSGPWTEGDWKSRNAARIYLLRLNRDGQAGFWWGRTHEEPERTAVGSWLGISQTSIVGVSRGLGRPLSTPVCRLEGVARTSLGLRLDNREYNVECGRIRGASRGSGICSTLGSSVLGANGSVGGVLG